MVDDVIDFLRSARHETFVSVRLVFARPLALSSRFGLFSRCFRRPALLTRHAPTIVFFIRNVHAGRVAPAPIALSLPLIAIVSIVATHVVTLLLVLLLFLLATQ